jgi:hypothetical protein
MTGHRLKHFQEKGKPDFGRSRANMRKCRTFNLRDVHLRFPPREVRQDAWRGRRDSSSGLG